eukprot:COSAG02_NODE_1223_length_13799_cov_11.479270_1_plen_80_part_00
MDTILQMGFAEYQAKKALAECGDNPEAAINYIMVSRASLLPRALIPRRSGAVPALGEHHLNSVWAHWCGCRLLVAATHG